MSVHVTLGVCAKNAEKTIRECVDSVIRQRYPTKLMQIIVVDGCSRDKTISVAVNAAASRNDLKVEIYSDGGKGLGTARQTVVDHANGKYLIYVDADVKLCEDFVEKHVKLMEENPEIGVAFGKLMHQEGTLVSTVWDLYHFTAGGFIGTDATIFRSEALVQAGGFDVSIRGAGEDVDLINRIKAKGWQTTINKDARFFHRFKENFRDFWNEQSWFGYGDHYRYHKNGDQSIFIGKMGGSFIFGLRIALKSYDLTHRKISFLIPFQMAFRDIAWWFGLIKGHVDSYGHRKGRSVVSPICA